MTQRNPMNERYQTGAHRGQTRKSAASMKPKSKAAASVRMQSTTKTKKQKKAEQKAARAKRNREEAQYYNPPTPEYRKWRKIWWVLLVLAVIMTIVTWFGRAYMSDTMGFVVLGIAYACIILAFYVDFSKIRKIRRAYRVEMEAAKKNKGKNGVKGKQQNNSASDSKK